MLEHFFPMASAATSSGRALLQEQFRTLKAQIPFLYALMFVDACFLSFATHGSVPLVVGLGAPAFLCLAALGRTIVWMRRRTLVPSSEEIRRQLAMTLVVAAVLSFGFGNWGLLLFENADLVQRTCIALYIFIGAISATYCLQSLPGAGRLVLLCGALPMTLRLLISGDWFLIGLGTNILAVLGLIARLLSTNYNAFVEVVSSRSEIMEQRERAHDAEQRAHELAYHDSLTGLANRRALGDHLEALLASEGEDVGAGLLIVDLDRFKSVNDVHGHHAGDLLLREVAARLLEMVGPAGRAYRLGGDEFAILVEVAGDDRDSPRRTARRVVQSISEPFELEDRVHHIGASVGISLFPGDARDRETLMRRADIALYRAKEGGRGQHRSFEPRMDAEIKRRSVIESELRETILADVLRPFYQPIVELSTGRTIGFELLARWPRSDGIEIGPEQFIPIAEESGLINELMLQLLDRACAEALGWDAELTIAINISPVQLKDPWLSQKILATLTRLGFPPSRLGIEITENALIVDANNARRTIESLKNQGMMIALDDFGTGYSSLQHLRMLPFDRIKIDRSFVRALEHSPDALKIIRAITSLASSLDLPVVAEGIESGAVADQLVNLGCAFGQGYHFGRPLSGAEVAERLAASPAIAPLQAVEPVDIGVRGLRAAS